MRRVAVLPVHNEGYSGEYLRSIDSEFSGELIKRALFEVVPVGRQQLESVIGMRQLASVEVLPSNLLLKLREHLGVDGVLFIDLTQFSPYQPVSMGVRMKLVDVSTGQIRWAYDSLFDASNPAVAQSARRHQINASESVRPIPGDGGSVLLSPTLFSKYVAAQSFRGLRARSGGGPRLSQCRAAWKACGALCERRTAQQIRGYATHPIRQVLQIRRGHDRNARPAHPHAL